MTRGGARKGAGRKTGQATAKTREIADKAAAEGITPLEVMLMTMRQAWSEATTVEGVTDLEKAIVASELAKNAAPYVHPRLAATEVKMEADVRNRVISGEPLNDDEWERKYGSGVGAPGGTTESPN